MTGRQRKGFTLIELLVVIAIIALLMSILMPALRKIRGLAKGIQCTSNVRNLVMAWYMYKDDHDGYLVRGLPGWEEEERDAWVMVATGLSDEEKKEAIRKGALFRYVSKSVGIYRCPADYRIGQEMFSLRSYSIPGGANGEDSPGVPEDGVATRYPELKRPASKYIFVEDFDPELADQARGYGIGSWILDLESPMWIDPVAMWHNAKSTLGFADGHVEMHKWRDKSFINWWKEGYYYMVPPDDEYEDIEYMVKGYPCKFYVSQAIVPDD
jgi:prepilin-type N-terminal cleavage/methylation domain-containing protein/prepilin-type processing-associated H-X9-DG protein